MASVRIHPSEVREGRLQLRSTDVDGASMQVEGVVTTFDDWVDLGAFEESMSPSVFDATLSRHADDIKLLVAHNSRAIPVAKPVDWVKHSDRLVGVWEFGSHDEAVKVHRAVDEGMLSGLSVGFNPGGKKADNEWSEDGRRVRRVNARLLEVSLVATPANAGAKVTQVRSAGVPAEVVKRAQGTPRLDEVRRRLDDMRK